MGPEALQALGVSRARAKRTDIESLAFEGDRKGGVVKLRIVGERHDCASWTQRMGGKGLIGPVRRKGDAGKSLLGRKCRSGINDSNRVVGKSRHACQRLRNMD